MNIEQIVDVKTAAQFLDVKWPDWYVGIDVIGCFHMDVCGECVLLNHARDGSAMCNSFIARDNYNAKFEEIFGFKAFSAEVPHTVDQRCVVELFGLFQIDGPEYHTRMFALNEAWKEEVLARYRAESVL